MEDRHRLLLVEDDDDYYVTVCSILSEVRGMAFEVQWAASYESALEQLGRDQVDICLMSDRLGARSGIELLREAIARGCGAPIIVLQNEPADPVDIDPIKAGAADCLLKRELTPPLLERALRFALVRNQVLLATRRSAERFALAVRGANDGLWDWDLTTDQLYVCPRWKAMLGFGAAEIGPNPDEWLHRVHPLDLDGFHEELDAHLAGRTSHFHAEYRVMHRDGHYRWMLSRGIAVRDASGKATRMAGSLTDITQRKDAEARLLHDAFHDPLTALPNRALFNDRLDRAILRVKRNENRPFAVLFLDLDDFKVVNDSLGHQAGDELLRSVGRRIASCLRADDTVARMGGDEFAILLEDLTKPDDAEGLAQRLLEEFTTQHNLLGHDVFISASIGISASGRGEERAEDLLRDADTAMYRAKAQGKARYVVYSDAMRSSAMARLTIESELRRAIENQEIRLHYQPIVNLNCGSITGLEVLVRWAHPDRGLILPGEFIPLAEATGLIHPLGHFILLEACRQMSLWQTRAVVPPDLAISVNLSSIQFAHPNLVHQLDKILSETSLDPQRLRVEITESVLMERSDAATTVMGKLRDRGIRLGMDDFGTGYS